MTTDWTRNFRRQFERDIEQGTKYIRAMSSLVEVRQDLEAYGYTPQVHREGRQLLSELMFSRLPWDRLPLSRAQQAAIEGLSRWHATRLEQARQILEAHNLEQAEYIFKHVGHLMNHPLLIVPLFLGRCQELREGTGAGRAGSREADRAAIALLESRQILGQDTEARLRGWIEQTRELGLPDLPEDMACDEADFREKAEHFHAWLTEWRETTRKVIRNRVHLNRLGLVKYHRK